MFQTSMFVFGDIPRIVGIVVAVFLLAMNLLNFAEMGIDKRRAKKDKWRVPESRFFLIALLGGSLGGWIGMKVFHHKTLHWYFRFGLPLIFIVQILAATVAGYYFFLR